MSKMMTIAVPDDAYKALKSAGEQSHQSPEELAAAAIAERFSPQRTAPSPDEQAQQAKEDFLALMRSHGYLVDPKSLPPHPGVADLPKPGTPERAQLEDELGNALSDALEQSGLSILDLIERR
ncbi:MAG: hypothetical protein ABI068_14450 [Ktedonobacterales bacterium]